MSRFVWNPLKELENILKHGVDFTAAQLAFEDSDRILLFDPAHSECEDRFFCIGKTGERILTVRFTHRGDQIRIIGAGYWRKGEVLYEKKKKKNGPGF